MEKTGAESYPLTMAEEETCRVFLIGDSLFTESLAQMLAEAENMQVVGIIQWRREVICRLRFLLCRGQSHTALAIGL